MIRDSEFVIRNFLSEANPESVMYKAIIVLNSDSNAIPLPALIDTDEASFHNILSAVDSGHQFDFAEQSVQPLLCPAKPA